MKTLLGHRLVSVDKLTVVDLANLFLDELPFLGPAWHLEPSECLFTMDVGTPWGDIDPPHSQRVTKRSELQRLNVGFNKLKKKYFATVYRDGTAHFGGCHATAQGAEAAARRLRLQLDGIHPAGRLGA